MVNPEDVAKLEEQILKVSRSTKTTIPALGPIHDWLRQTLPWYYTWHTRAIAIRVHVLLLIVLLVIIAYVFLRATADIR